MDQIANQHNEHVIDSLLYAAQLAEDIKFNKDLDAFMGSYEAGEQGGYYDELIKLSKNRLKDSKVYGDQND